jgi:hypothetical protein
MQGNKSEFGYSESGGKKSKTGSVKFKLAASKRGMSFTKLTKSLWCQSKNKQPVIQKVFSDPVQPVAEPKEDKHIVPPLPPSERPLTMGAQALQPVRPATTPV